MEAYNLLVNCQSYNNHKKTNQDLDQVASVTTDEEYD